MDSKTALEHERKLWCQVKRGELSLDDISVQVSGNFAYVTLLLSNSITLLSNSFVTRTRATIIFRKRRSWEIVHEHWSSADPEELPEFLNPIKDEEFLIHSN